MEKLQFIPISLYVMMSKDKMKTHYLLIINLCKLGSLIYKRSHMVNQI